jgi:hypothetical protein
VRLQQRHIILIDLRWTDNVGCIVRCIETEMRLQERDSKGLKENVMGANERRAYITLLAPALATPTTSS